MFITNILQKGINFKSLYLNYIIFNNYALGFLIAACAAANLAIGTLNGEQDT